MTDIPADPFEATRVADVDPATGVERGTKRGDADATVIGARSRPDGPPPKRTARFVPERGESAADDATAAWPDGGRPCTRRRPRPSKRSVRAAALALAALAAIPLAFLAAPGKEKRASEAVGAAPPEVEAAPGPAAPLPGRGAEGGGGPGGARLVDLVDALSEGRLEEARGICRALAAASPADEALRATGEILSLYSEGNAP